MSEPVLVDGTSLSLEDVERVARGSARVRLAPEARQRMEASRAVVERALEEGRAVYGVTTGFGRLSDTAIDAEDIRGLQRNLLFSHAAGVGDPLAADVVRAMALLRANTLAGGRCGVRPVVCERLLEILDAGIHPRVPAQGSVGASGDLAPLAHLALLLIGEGEVWRKGPDGSAGWVPAAAVLADHGIEPIRLEAKEGLSLVNGTQLMTAVGALTLLDAERLVEAAEVSGALSLEAMRGTRSALREEIHTARPHPGQVESAARLRSLLGETSEIGDSHKDCGRVQDPYSIRCMPQVHG
ncbi:MAG: aromatic amino acid lyase, partial [Gemmatimonadota bacterium]|nr:aromatic amino acid lyase [Gemmatimonadota bacterium]